MLKGQGADLQSAVLQWLPGNGNHKKNLIMGSTVTPEVVFLGLVLEKFEEFPP